MRLFIVHYILNGQNAVFFVNAHQDWEAQNIVEALPRFKDEAKITLIKEIDMSKIGIIG